MELKELKKIVALIGLSGVMVGCSSPAKDVQETSQKLAITIPAKSDDARATYNEQWLNNPYKQSMTARTQFMKVFGSMVSVHFTDSFCSGTDPVVGNDDKSESIVTAKVERSGKATIESILSSLPADYQAKINLPTNTNNGENGEGINAVQAFGYLASAPIMVPAFLTLGVLDGAGQVFSGKLFRDREPERIMARSNYSTGKQFGSDEEVYYVVLDVEVRNRKERLLYPVETPSLPRDWALPISYKVVYAVKAHNETEGRLALCGLVAK